MASVDPTLLAIGFMVGTMFICYVVYAKGQVLIEAKELRALQLWAFGAFIVWAGLFVFALTKTTQFKYLMNNENDAADINSSSSGPTLKFEKMHTVPLQHIAPSRLSVG